MSYISAWKKRDCVYVWERDQNGKRVTKYHPNIFEFYVKDTNGPYTSIYNEPLEKVTFDSWQDMKQAREYYTDLRKPMYESDLSSEMKVLSTHYYKKEAPKLHYTLWDIEVDYDPKQGFSSVEDPYAPINAVALYHHWKQESVVIAVPPKSWDKSNKLQKLAKDTNTTIHLVETEKELLLMLLDQFEDSDVISGWNSDFFDTPYTAKRIQKVLGSNCFKRLSFRDSHPPRFREVELFGQPRTICDLGGRISWDYLELFRKFEMTKRSSYKLEVVSNEILPNLSKLSYSGTLHQLYNNDFEYFINYNIRDTAVLKGFEEKLGYLELANTLYHSACGQPNNILGTIKLTELSVINHCHYNLDQKVPDTDMYAESSKIKGAMVLTPKAGLHDNIGSIDITSLYPSCIRLVNISPETIIGQSEGSLTNDDRGTHSAWKIIHESDDQQTVTVVYDTRTVGYSGVETHTGAEWRKLLFERKWAISGYGTFFNQDNTGIIPSVLEDWFNERKRYKKLMKTAKDAVSKLENLTNLSNDQKSQLIEFKSQASYYDRLQYVYKIKLNASYGALSNAYFRFFDMRLGQSTTGTGRAILEHMCSVTAEMLDGEYDMFSKSIIYGDTDSVYFKTNAETFIDKTSDQQQDVAIEIADAIGKHADQSFDDFCIKAFCIQDDYRGIIRCDREVVARRGIFVSKKKYVLKLTNLDGYSCDKLKTTGLEMKKTTTPKVIQTFLEDVVNMILDGEKTWKFIEDYIVGYRQQVLTDLPILEIGLPKGVNKVEHYTQIYKLEGEKARLPGHVAASLFYNNCLKHFNDTDHEPITSGSKIKVFYLTRKYGKFKSIAFPTEMKQPPKWFTENFQVDRKQHETRLIDNNLNIIFTAIQQLVPTAQTQFNDTIFDW